MTLMDHVPAPWLEQLPRVVHGYPAGPNYVLHCRRCGAGWKLPRLYRRPTHAPALREMRRHALRHAAEAPADQPMTQEERP